MKRPIELRLKWYEKLYGFLCGPGSKYGLILRYQRLLKLGYPHDNGMVRALARMYEEFA